MLLRHLFVCVGLVLLVLLERLGYYAARADLVLFMMGGPQEGGLGMSQSSALEAYGLWTGLLYAMPLLGGVVAIFTGPRVPLVLGAVLTSLGFWALGNVPAGAAESLMLPLALVTLGQGLFKPSLYVLAADELPHPREGGRNALFVALYVAINLGATLSAVVSQLLVQAMGLQSVAEVLIWPLIYSSVVSGAPRRFAPLVFAGLLLVNMLLGNMLPFLAGRSDEAVRVLLGLSVVGCAVTAGVLFARWRRVTEWFQPPAPPAAPAGVFDVR